MVAGVGKLYLNQSIKDTIVFVKSIFSNYQQLLYLSKGAPLQFAQLQTAICSVQNSSLEGYKLEFFQAKTVVWI